MKKLLAVFILIVSVLTLFACKPQVTYNFYSGAYWLNDSTISQIANVNEVCEYDVNFLPKNQDDVIQAQLNGKLTTSLTTSEYVVAEKKVDCYLFTTNLTVSGKYVYYNEEKIVNDTLTSECYFLSLNDHLKPLYSAKSVDCLTPSSDVTGSEYYFNRYKYQITTTYNIDKGTANTTYVRYGGENMDVSEPTVEKSYEKLFKGDYFDNELLMFFPRCIDFANGYTKNFSSIDVLAQKNNSMRIYVSSTETEATSNLILDNIKINGIDYDKDKQMAQIMVYNAEICINDTFSGSPIKLSFANNSTEHHKRLIKLSTSLSNFGELEYTLKTVTYNA